MYSRRKRVFLPVAASLWCSTLDWSTQFAWTRMCQRVQSQSLCNERCCVLADPLNSKQCSTADAAAQHDSLRIHCVYRCMSALSLPVRRNWPHASSAALTAAALLADCCTQAAAALPRQSQCANETTHTAADLAATHGVITAQQEHKCHNMGRRDRVTSHQCLLLLGPIHSHSSLHNTNNSLSGRSNHQARLHPAVQIKATCATKAVPSSQPGRKNRFARK